MEIFEQFDKKWALVTAGTIGAFNTMTVSWGGLGTLWSKPAATIYVRPNRYTYDFLNENEYFTICFFDEEARADLAYLGSHSGRDGDKVAQTSLHAVPVGASVGWVEATLTLLCRKTYWQDMDPERIPSRIKERFYEHDPVHRMYIGEVVEILKK
ncbi:MAG: flavin reductase [Eubacteriales bacterium]|nr:flavin reductase [Eubacteriales bacterium]